MKPSPSVSRNLGILPWHLQLSKMLCCLTQLGLQLVPPLQEPRLVLPLPVRLLLVLLPPLPRLLLRLVLLQPGQLPRVLLRRVLLPLQVLRRVLPRLVLPQRVLPRLQE